MYRPDNGLFGDRPQIRNVTFSPSGTSPCAFDPYYTRLALPATNCTFDASVFMDWGSRPLAPDGEFEATIQVGSGTPRNLAGSAPQGPVGRFRHSDLEPRAGRRQGQLEVHAEEQGQLGTLHTPAGSMSNC